MVLTNKLNQTQDFTVGQTGDILNAISMIEMLDKRHLVRSEIFVFEEQYLDKKRQLWLYINQNVICMDRISYPSTSTPTSSTTRGLKIARNGELLNSK